MHSAKTEAVIITIFLFALSAASFTLVNDVARDTQALFDETAHASAQAASAEAALQILKNKQYTEDVYTIVLVGDIMLDRNVRASVYNNYDGDYGALFSRMAPILKKADVAFANLEGPISSRGVDSGKEYSFRFEPVVASELSEAGFDVLSLANNHILDWGADALCDTYNYLRAYDVQSVGAGCASELAHAPALFSLGDTRVAFIGATEFYTSSVARDGLPGVSQWSLSHIEQHVRSLKEAGTDIVIVSLHWGVEYETRSSSYQQEFAHALVDAGADIVVGHHPHVIQEIERYGKGWILYSLGNFIFDQSFSEETMRGILANVRIQDGVVIAVDPLPVVIDTTFRPYLVE